MLSMHPAAKYTRAYDIFLSFADIFRGMKENATPLEEFGEEYKFYYSLPHPSPFRLFDVDRKTMPIFHNLGSTIILNMDTISNI